MRTLTALYLLVAAAADHGTWDHPQQAELPSHEWLVVDHAQGRGVVPRVVPRGYYGQLRALWYYAGCTVGRGSPRS